MKLKDPLNVKDYAWLVDASFRRNGAVQNDGRWGRWLACGIYSKTRRFHLHQAERRIQQAMPEIALAQYRAREEGGLKGDFQFGRLLEIFNILHRFKPANVLELGSGTSTGIFVRHFKDSSKVLTAEEDSYWRERTLEALGPLSQWADIRRVDKKIATSEGELACYYDIDHAQPFDMVYLDGPSNASPNGELGIDGTPHMICLDVERMWASGNFPKLIAVDGRRTTLRRLILKGSERYQVYLSSNLQPHVNPLKAFRFQHHSILFRRDATFGGR